MIERYASNIVVPGVGEYSSTQALVMKLEELEQLMYEHSNGNEICHQRFRAVAKVLKERLK